MDTDSANILKPGERFDDLEINNLKIIQHEDKYCFTTDSVLLSSFARIKTGETAVDLGTGSGIIAILLAAKTPLKHIYGVEIQEYMADMAKRSVEFNDLSDRITILNAPMQNVHEKLGLHNTDVVVTNPPYRQRSSGGVQLSDEISISRHEITVTLEEVIRSASGLLKYGGRFYMIHRADRLADIICCMRANLIEPKKLRYIVNKRGDAPGHVLIEGIDHGKPGLITEKNLVLYEDNGEYTDETKRIYNL